jgi:helix-turn-helix, Psq domain
MSVCRWFSAGPLYSNLRSLCSVRHVVKATSRHSDIHYFQYWLITKITNFSTISFQSTKSPPNITQIDAQMEDRIQQAIKYLQENPGASLAKAAREFAVPRGRLRYRAEGRPPRKGIRAANTRLTVAEEAAVCRYIDRLDHINLAVRAEFITDAANAILRERSRDPEAHVSYR